MINPKKLRCPCAFVCCIAALVCACTGCSDASNSSDGDGGVNVAMEDMEYGATMRDDDTHAVPLEYDKRFLEDAELDALANYYAAIQNEDETLFASCILREYMESLYQNAYAGLLDDSAYLTQQHNNFQKLLDGNDFTFSRILVNDCIDQNETGSNTEYLTDMIDELKGDDSYCANHMQSCKTLTVQPVLTDGSTSVSGDEVTVFLICLDDTYYVCA